MRNSASMSLAYVVSALLLPAYFVPDAAAQPPEPRAVPAPVITKLQPPRPERWAGKITAIDAVNKTVRLVRSNTKISATQTVTTVEVALRQMEQNLTAADLKVGDTLSAFWTLTKPDEDYKGVFIQFGRYNSEWNIATVTSVNPLTLEIDGKAMKLSLSVLGDDYAFEWGRWDEEHNRTSHLFISGIDQQTLTRTVLGPTTFQFNIPNVAVLTTTNSRAEPNSPLPQLLDRADTAGISLQHPETLTFTRVAPLEFSALQVGQSIIANVEVTAEEKVGWRTNKIVRVKRITIDLTPKPVSPAQNTKGGPVIHNKARPDSNWPKR